MTRTTKDASLDEQLLRQESGSSARQIRRVASIKARMTEDAFLEALIGWPATVYLINGIKLEGILRDHDAEVIFLRPHDTRDGSMEMISKAATSTIIATLPTSTDRDSGDSLDGILSRAVRIPRA